MPKAPRRREQHIPNERFFRFLDAAHTDRSLALRMLREDPSLINVSRGSGETVLHYLAIENYLEIVAWLISRGANVNSRDSSHSTPLIHAAQLGLVDMCRLLLENGADVTAKDSRGYTVISAATRSMGKSRASQERTLVLIDLLLSYFPKDADINEYLDAGDIQPILNREDALTERFIAIGLKTPSYNHYLDE